MIFMLVLLWLMGVALGSAATLILSDMYAPERDERGRFTKR
jgi:hypothetical protein